MVRASQNRRHHGQGHRPRLPPAQASGDQRPCHHRRTCRGRGNNPSYVSRTLRLTLLAPDIAINSAFFDYDPGNLGRVRYDSPSSARCRRRRPPVRTTSGPLRLRSAATMATGPDGRSAISPCLPQHRCMATTPRASTTPTPPPRRSGTIDGPEPDPLDRRPEARRGRRSAEPLRQSSAGTPRSCRRSGRPASASTIRRATTSAARATKASPTASLPSSKSSATASTCTPNCAGTTSTGPPRPA